MKLFSVKDFEVQTFRAGGKGGQHQNKTDTGVRIKHIRSGAVAESRETRSQVENKKRAFKRLIEGEVFKKWLRLEVARVTGRLAEIEAEIDRSLERDVLIEVKDERGRWHKQIIY